MPLLPLAVVIVLAVRRVPPTLAMLAGALTGGLVAVLLQPDQITHVEPHAHFSEAPSETEFYGVSGQQADKGPDEGLD